MSEDKHPKPSFAGHEKILPPHVDARRRKLVEELFFLMGEHNVDHCSMNARNRITGGKFTIEVHVTEHERKE